MKFYDMVSNYEDDMYAELPSDILGKLDELKANEFKEKYNDATSIINNIWEMNKVICKKYIETDWIENLGINKNELLEDIKYHSIFTTFLSIINKEFEGKTVDECADVYYDSRDIKKSPGYFNNHFNNKLNEWIELIANSECSKGVFNSDLYYCFYEETKDKNAEENDEILIYIDSMIFYEVINSWKECPFDKKYSLGMTFKQLYKFYEKLEILIKEPDNNIDKSIKAFTVERLFNISFLYRLSKYVENKHNENVDKFNEENRKYRDQVMKQYEDEIAKKILMTQECQNVSQYNNLKMYEANTLLALSEIVSIPMVFSRNKYIDIIYKEYELNISKDTFGYLKLKNNLFYLNYYLIPLLSKVYYYLLYSYTCRNSEKIGTFTYMEKLLREYINENPKGYMYDEAIVDDKVKFEKGIGNEAFEVNVTEIIYNYEFCRSNFDMSDDIFMEMKKIEDEVTSEFINSRSKYNYNEYQRDFPSNRIYSIYKNNKNKI